MVLGSLADGCWVLLSCSTSYVLPPASSSPEWLLAYMQFPVKYQHATLKITGFDHTNVDQIEGEAGKNHAETTQTDRPLSESRCPESTERILVFLPLQQEAWSISSLPLFLSVFQWRSPFWGGGRENFRVRNPKGLEAFGEACMRLSCWVAGRRQAHRWRRLGMSPVIWDILIQPVHFRNLNWLVAVARSFLSSSFFPTGLIQGLTVCKYLLRSLYHQPTQNTNMSKSIKLKERHTIQDPIFALRSKHFA